MRLSLGHVAIVALIDFRIQEIRFCYQSLFIFCFIGPETWFSFEDI
jgi:hypothetical protein